MGFEQAGGTMTIFADEQTARAATGFTQLFIAVFVSFCAWALWFTTRKESSGQGLWRGLTVMFAVGGGYYLVQTVQAFGGAPQGEIPASMFQAINPLLIVAFAPFIGSIWNRLDANPRTRSSSAVKMSVGMAILGLGFVLMYVGQQQAAGGVKVGPQWLFGVYALHTLGEFVSGAGEATASTGSQYDEGGGGRLHGNHGDGN